MLILGDVHRGFGFDVRTTNWNDIHVNGICFYDFAPNPELHIPVVGQALFRCTQVNTYTLQEVISRNKVEWGYKARIFYEYWGEWMG